MSDMFEIKKVHREESKLLSSYVSSINQLCVAFEQRQEWHLWETASDWQRFAFNFLTASWIMQACSISVEGFLGNFYLFVVPLLLGNGCDTCITFKKQREKIAETLR